MGPYETKTNPLAGLALICGVLLFGAGGLALQGITPDTSPWVTWTWWIKLWAAFSQIMIIGFLVNRKTTP